MKLRLLVSSLLLTTGFALNAQSIGLIGPASPNGNWDVDVDLTLSPDSANFWTADFTLKADKCKFRQDDAWDINWGAIDFPSGTGTQGGPDIPVPYAGDYHITFNAANGDYHFLVKSDIGIIGDATPKGWGEDTNMYPENDSTYILTINLGLGKCKFRKDDAWDINWGSTDFPTGIGTQGGPDIPIAKAGKYIVKFNKNSGAYSFEEKVDFTAIGLIGSATPNDWAGPDMDLVQDNANPDLWKADLTLLDGECKFRANDAWDISWGDTTFPSGVAIIGGPNIKNVVAGDYKVSFNTNTREYTFLKIGDYSSIGIIGDATPGGWANETGLDKDPVDKSIWRKRLKLENGFAKFRANNAWTINWGSGDFPVGTGTQDGADIPITKGEYKITFNSTTGAYEFVEVIVFDTIGLIGNSIPGNNWDADVYMTKSPTNEYLFTINSITLLDAPVDGGVKFRANSAWAINWGAIDFPTGIGTQDGHNIEPKAGTYGVTFITDSGAYAFGDPISGTDNLFTADAVRFSPNPATDLVVVSTESKEMTGSNVRAVVFDQQGRRVLEQELSLIGSANLNTATLKTGNYMVQLTNGKYVIGKPLVIVR